MYFHAYFHRDNPTTLQKDYELLPHVEGRGRYLGVNIGIIANMKEYFNTWWGEGEVKVYMDGDREWPTLSGTGTEDYIGSAWGQGKFVNQYTGSPVADEKNLRYCFYRYHIPDPIYFYKEARVTIQQIGYLGGNERPPFVQANRRIYKAGPGLVEKDISKDGLFERQDDVSSCVYFYLDKPENHLPPLAPVSQRVEGL